METLRILQMRDLPQRVIAQKEDKIYKKEEKRNQINGYKYFVA